MSPSDAAANCFDLMAEGLYRRLRDILLAQSRWDSFVHDPEEEGHQEASPALSPEEATRVAAELVLRAFRAGLDPVNHLILARLVAEKAVHLSSLMELTGLPRIPLTERVNDLAQVGLASHSVDTREVHATSLAEGLLVMLAEIRDRLVRTMEERERGPGER